MKSSAPSCAVCSVESCKEADRVNVQESTGVTLLSFTVTDFKSSTKISDQPEILQY